MPPGTSGWKPGKTVGAGRYGPLLSLVRPVDSAPVADLTAASRSFRIYHGRYGVGWWRIIHADAE
jgi:hypothetical protein